MKTGKRLSDYLPVLLEKRKNEFIKKDDIFETNEGMTSPPGATSTEEIRIFNQYAEQANLLKIAEASPRKKKICC